MEGTPMRTQQQALTELCKGFRPFIRRAFLYEWLQDINWHAEAALLLEGFSDQHAELIAHLKKFHIARNEYYYSTEYFTHLKKAIKLSDHIKILQDIREKEEGFFMNGIFISPDVMQEFEKAMSAYGTVACIYGWGIDKSEFNGHIKGKALVDELEKIIESKE
jgi:hypothetical protein